MLGYSPTNVFLAYTSNTNRFVTMSVSHSGIVNWAFERYNIDGYGYGTHFNGAGRVYSLGIEVITGIYGLTLLELDAVSSVVYSRTLLNVGSFSSPIVVAAMKGDGDSIAACL